MRTKKIKKELRRLVKNLKVLGRELFALSREFFGLPEKVHRENLDDLLKMLQLTLAVSRIQKKVFEDGTEIHLIHPQKLDLEVSWHQIFAQVPTVARGKRLEIWLYEHGFDQSHWKRAYQLSEGFLIRVNLPQERMSVEALNRLLNLKLQWGMGVISGLPEHESYGKAILGSQGLVNLIF